MTREEAERILAKVACSCDGYGVVPGPYGVIMKCPNCDGEFVPNTLLKVARRVLAEEKEG